MLVDAVLYHQGTRTSAENLATAAERARQKGGFVWVGLHDPGPDEIAEVAEVFDLHPLVKDHYYHPDMLGSWSIKAVLPCIAPEMDYAALDGIRDGTAASDGFLQAISPGVTAARKAELREQLLRYCRFDTEAMLAIVHFFSAAEPL